MIGGAKKELLFFKIKKNQMDDRQKVLGRF